MYDAGPFTEALTYLGAAIHDSFYAKNPQRVGRAKLNSGWAIAN